MAIDDDSVTPGELPAIAETPAWVEHLPAMITGVKVRGGDAGEGAANFQARVIDARLRFLKQAIEDSGGGGIILIGPLETESELLAIPTEGLRVGTAYFVDFALRVWNGTTWGSSGSLRGERGVNLLGVWPDQVPLPEASENVIGDGYLWQHDIWILVPVLNDPEATPVWEGMGIRGPEGKSTYELFKEIPGNENKTLQQFITEQKGEKGDDAFETWKKIPGNEGKTIDDWNLANKGIQGDEGPARGPFHVDGVLADPSLLPRPGDEAIAYYVGSDLYVWVEKDTDYVVIPGVAGKSAFEMWLEKPGNAGKTEADMWEDLKGKDGDDAFETWKKIPGNENKTITDWQESNKGVQGEEGPARAPFHVEGVLANTGLLPTPGDAEKAYYVGIDLYVWVATDNNYAMIPGIAGKSSFEMWLEKPGNEGKTEADMWEDLKGEKGDASTEPGPKGADGRNLRVLGTVATSDDLAGISLPADQDAYATLDTGRLWMYLPAEGGWKDLGPWRGNDGKSAFELWVEDGHAGASLPDFWAALKGKDGNSMVVRGAVATLADLPAIPEEQWLYAVRDESAMYMYLGTAWVNLGTFGKDGVDGKDGQSLEYIKVLSEEDQVPPVASEENKGKAYISWNPRDVFINTDGTGWENAGPFQPPGEIGPVGKSFRPKGTVADLASLPAIGGEGGAEEGDAYSVIDQGKMLYCVVDGNWEGPIDTVGPEGKQGIQGNPGALMPILGMYQTVAALKAAHPTGNLGDAYLIVDPGNSVRNLAIWSTTLNDWQDTGPAGIPGAPGAPGADSTVPGPKGEKGSQWLNLQTMDAPSGTFNGRPGDWAVNLLNHVYYKTVNQGWIYWSTLVSGDVNSPLLAEGKVVRLGNAWVPLPVDEVENAEENAYYARRLVGEEINWAKLPKIIDDLTTKDSKQYVRVFLAAGTVPVWAELSLSGTGAIKDIDAPEENALYLRFANNGTWVKYTPAPSDTFQYVQKGGNWITLDRMDAPILSMSASGSVDPKVNQVVALANSTSTAKTITLGDGPKVNGQIPARAQSLIVTVSGSAGVVSFAATGGTVLSWHGGTPPSLTGTLTNIVFWWTGTQWIGQLGAVVP